MTTSGGPHDYAGAVAFLAKSRGANKDTYRRLAPNRYVARLDDATIGLVLHSTVIVAWHADGTETIRTGGWDTVTTKKWINYHSHAQVWSVDCQLYVRLPEPALSPARVQRCRRCKGTGELPDSCYGPGYCYAWGQEMCEHGERSNHRRERCEHGQTEGHALANRPCWGCEGNGRRDYGSHPLHLKWSGEPLVIGASGFPMPECTAFGYGAPCKPYTHTSPVYHSVTPQPNPNVVDGSVVTQSLAALLPGLQEAARCPACDTDNVIRGLVIHLNDAHSWTREQIADWLDTLDVSLAFPAPAS